MIGNDIIDLGAASAESNPLRRGWIDKVFSASEKELLTANGNTLQAIWLLWSMKEAAYKIYNRLSGKVFYAPQQFVCIELKIDHSNATGSVTFGKCKYFTKSIISADYLHSVATLESEEAPQLSIQPAGENYSDVLPQGYQFIRWEGRPPLLFDEHVQDYLPASYSHHGRWQALAFINKQKMNDYGKN